MSSAKESVADWRGVSRALAEEEPVFIVGMARCGTTALRNTMESLPVFEPRGKHSPETKAFCRPESIHRLLTDRDDRLSKFLLDDREEAERLLESADAIRAGTARRRRVFARLTGRLAEKDALRRLAWRVRGHHHLLRQFFHHARRARGTERIFEKTPAHATRLPEMHVTFPKLRVIAMFRHPVDTYCSFRKRLQWSIDRDLPEPAYAWLRISARRFANRFRRRFVGVTRFRTERPDQLLLLRYEDLTTRPESVLPAICTFIGEPFDEATLLGSRDEDRTGVGTPKPSARLMANPAEWRKWLEEDEVRRIEEMLADVMEEFGYASVLTSEGEG